MKFEDFTNKLVEISLKGPTEELRDSALELYMQTLDAVFDESGHSTNFLQTFFDR